MRISRRSLFGLLAAAFVPVPKGVPALEPDLVSVAWVPGEWMSGDWTFHPPVGGVECYGYWDSIQNEFVNVVPYNEPGENWLRAEDYKSTFELTGGAT